VTPNSTSGAKFVRHRSESFGFRRDVAVDNDRRVNAVSVWGLLPFYLLLFNYFTAFGAPLHATI